MRALLLILMVVWPPCRHRPRTPPPVPPSPTRDVLSNPKGPKSPTVAQPRGVAAACAPATALRNLEWNNVRALLENGGSLWYNRSIDKGSYFVPKEPA